MNINNIITGEKLQQLCDVYLGLHEDFHYNPLIQKEIYKQKNINTIYEKYYNPRLIFCYIWRIRELSNIIHLFQNPFILVTHNGDKDVINIDYVNKILNNSLLLKWYSQNVCIQNNEKLQMLPIGFANSQWHHGNISLFEKSNIFNNIYNKTNNIFFNFSIRTNIRKRQPCFNQLKNKLEWLSNIEPVDNLTRLSAYKFCICPEGNGVDTHRLWEALYLKVVPIVINSEFTQTLIKNNIPLVVLDSWEQLDINSLNYDNYVDKFNDDVFKNLLDFQYIKNKILSN